MRFIGGLWFLFVPIFALDGFRAQSSRSRLLVESCNDILNNLYAPDYTIQEVGPVFDGAMRQQHVTAGVSFTF